MKCWKCGIEEPDPFGGKLSFRATCDVCGADLHCCRNCVYYSPGKPNDCAVPGTDYVADRAVANLCEEFRLIRKGSSDVGPNQLTKRLFGEDLADENKDPKQRFNSLFGPED